VQHGKIAMTGVLMRDHTAAFRAVFEVVAFTAKFPALSE
jgi:hypothetical protein